MKLIGRPGSRYATETYPQGPGGGGGGEGGSVPLSRQRFIDGGTIQSGRNGSAAKPFKTIAEFIASRTNSSAPDATANYVGWLMPALNGYAENVAFPPYASTELRADSISLVGGSGTVVTGNLTWPNIAGANTPSEANVAVHNVTVAGTFVVTDDVNAPPSTVVFGGDEVGVNNVALGGFDSSATQKLSAVTLLNTILGGALNAGTSSTSAGVDTVNCACGNVSARSLSAVDTVFDASAITVNSAGAAIFEGCVFQSAAVLTCLAGASFDGPSWRSFTENGGTRSAGTSVLVVGGYSGAAVEGKDLTDGNVVVSLNGTGAVTTGFTGENSGNHYSSSGISGDRSVALLPDGALNGDTMLITKKDLAAHTLHVDNGGSTPGTIGIIPSGSRGFVLAQFNAGTGDWVLAQCGSLAA